MSFHSILIELNCTKHIEDIECVVNEALMNDLFFHLQQVLLLFFLHYRSEVSANEHVIEFLHDCASCQSVHKVNSEHWQTEFKSCDSTEFSL